MIEILIKKLSKNVTLPKYETEGSSGLDLAANIDEQIKILPGKSEIIFFTLIPFGEANLEGPVINVVFKPSLLSAIAIS